MINKSSKNARVTWITGLSGSGKTTIGKIVVEQLRSKGLGVVFLDGDVLRHVLDAEDRHSIKDRKKLALTYSKLCKMFADQNLNVVCSTVSMFDEVRDLNRQSIPDYLEIYLKVPFDILMKRDQKGLYSGAKKGDIRNLVGVDMAFEEPKAPDLVIVNDGTDTPELLATRISKFDIF